MVFAFLKALFISRQREPIFPDDVHAAWERQNREMSTMRKPKRGRWWKISSPNNKNNDQEP